MYIADAGNSRIRKVTVSTGIITTIAGNGGGPFSGDGGDATSAGLYGPNAVALDTSGTFHYRIAARITDVIKRRFSIAHHLYFIACNHPWLIYR